MPDDSSVRAFLRAEAGVNDSLRGEEGHDSEDDEELKGDEGTGDHHGVREREHGGA